MLLHSSWSVFFYLQDSNPVPSQKRAGKKLKHMKNGYYCLLITPCMPQFQSVQNSNICVKHLLPVHTCTEGQKDLISLSLYFYQVKIFSFQEQQKQDLENSEE